MSMDESIKADIAVDMSEVKNEEIDYSGIENTTVLAGNAA